MVLVSSNRKQLVPDGCSVVGGEVHSHCFIYNMKAISMIILLVDHLGKKPWTGQAMMIFFLPLEKSFQIKYGAFLRQELAEGGSCPYRIHLYHVPSTPGHS